MIKEKWCVYCHTNKINGKKYIGISSNVDKRWAGKGTNYYDQVFGNAIKKYGWDNFTHEIVFENLTKEEACEKESELILLNKSNIKEYGYNRSNGGESGSKGAYDVQFNRMRKVYRYDLDGKFIEEHISISNALRKIGCTNGEISNICLCCQGKRNMAYGYMWSYEYLGEKINRHITSKEITSKIRSKKIYQYSENGDFLREYSSQKEASDDVNITVGALQSACNRKGFSCGYLWRNSYEGEKISTKDSLGHDKSQRSGNSKKVYKYSKDMSLISTFKSIKETSKLENISIGKLIKHIEYRIILNSYIYSFEKFTI